MKPLGTLRSWSQPSQSGRPSSLHDTRRRLSRVAMPAAAQHGPSVRGWQGTLDPQTCSLAHHEHPQLVFLNAYSVFGMLCLFSLEEWHPVLEVRQSKTRGQAVSLKSQSSQQAQAGDTGLSDPRNRALSRKGCVCGVCVGGAGRVGLV